MSTSNRKLYTIVRDNYDKVLIALFVYIDWYITVEIVKYTTPRYSFIHDGLATTEISIHSFQTIFLIKSIIVYMLLVGVTKWLSLRVRAGGPDREP